jgi:hypothetical protein
MGWEYRGMAGPYYTRSLRRHGRVVRQYLGRGPLVEEFAHEDALAREARRLARDRWAERRRTQEALRAGLLALRKQLSALTCSTLSEVGYHQHRGQWRRRRRSAG